jgi:hypothetical protein
MVSSLANGQPIENYTAMDDLMVPVDCLFSLNLEGRKAPWLAIKSDMSVWVDGIEIEDNDMIVGALKVFAQQQDAGDSATEVD